MRWWSGAGDADRKRTSRPAVADLLGEALHAKLAGARNSKGRVPPLAESVRAGGMVVSTPTPTLAGSDPVDPELAARGYQTALMTTSGATFGVKDGLLNAMNLEWLGILYYDRIRLRPSGIVVGDHVYTLALAPGEETTLTQRSETKRTRSFEEILDRTAERELEFSSTWSTDLTNQDVATTTSTVGGNLGTTVGGSIEGVQVQAGGAANASQSSADTSSRQTTRNQEATARAAAKTRAAQGDVQGRYRGD